MQKFESFAQDLAKAVVAESAKLVPHPDNVAKVLAQRKNGSYASLDLTPFAVEPKPATAQPFFENVQNFDELMAAYEAASKALPFEMDIFRAEGRIHAYADQFLADLFAKAKAEFSDVDARRVALWVKDFDIYVAVKAVESMLNSKADMTVLHIADRLGWTAHFDHLAIRCGSSRHLDSERVVKMLVEDHGYSASQVEGEDYYVFDDGWNAYPVYKLLDNGQVIRLFIDQSAEDDEVQIIQHWNRAYGFTSHHLAMTLTKLENGQRRSVSLTEVIAQCKENGVTCLTPTGLYTEQLLEQVFTKPEINGEVPAEIKAEVAAIHPDLPKQIENGKLLELVARREMSPAFVERFYGLYGIAFDAANPLHYAPIYPYFLPAQAAHVIKTSIGVASAVA
ncbi:MAG: hypothetical protein HYV16_04950 [Gammaproteobacteria bacterium]|nr:hypothetical protein [Gammaproteobacteria bacterium]